MATRDKRVDAYIAKSADFAKPILDHLRELVHKACPDVEEKMKWSFPHFDYKGMMCSMAAFKEHCSFGFWKASLMKDARKFSQVGETGMGHLGKIHSLDELPSDKTLIAYIKEAARLNADGVKLSPKTKPIEKKILTAPADLKQALSKNKRALQTFDGFSHSNKREYVEWITEAKTPETRTRRLATAIEWMAEGKSRNWKYERR
jgi:uncharacterized protein YdeI (YjbR/CyaY-like superfamily)